MTTNRIALSADACATLQFALDVTLSEELTNRDILLGAGVPADDFEMTEQAKRIGTMRNLVDVLSAAIGVEIVL